VPDFRVVDSGRAPSVLPARRRDLIGTRGLARRSAPTPHRQRHRTHDKDGGNGRDARPGPDRRVGVDTHADTHLAVALDQLGHRLDAICVAANRRGYAQMIEWANALGSIDRIGIEGTGSWGRGLSLQCLSLGLRVMSIDPIARQADATERATRPTPKPPLAPCSPAASSVDPPAVVSLPAKAPSKPLIARDVDRHRLRLTSLERCG
jgi:hypothetical protein